MKIYLTATLILLFSGFCLSQELAENPKEIFNKSGNQMFGITGLVNCTQNGKGNFQGKISGVQLDYKYSEYNFDVGNRTFSLDYEKISNVGRGSGSV